MRKGPESTDENQNSNREQLLEQQYKTNKSEDNAPQRADDDEVEYENCDIDQNQMDIVSADKLFSRFERSGREQSNAHIKDIGIGINTTDLDDTAKQDNYYFDTDTRNNDKSINLN